jgi:hypothetical protein
MPARDSAIARAAIFEIIENQMRDRTPPETKQTYDRLIADGHSNEETTKLIGCVVASEILDILKREQPYDEVRYCAALRALPKMPWEY